MTQVILNDQEILDKTTQFNENGYVKFKFVVPGKGGRTITSNSIAKSDIGAATLIEWCNSIRGQMEADYNAEHDEKEAKRQTRIKAEDEAKNLQKAVDEAVQSIPEAQDNDISVSSGKLVLPASVQANKISNHINNLWTTYGNLLGELERVKAQLRAAGEKL